MICPCNQNGQHKDTDKEIIIKTYRQETMGWFCMELFSLVLKDQEEMEDLPKIKKGRLWRQHGSYNLFCL